MATYTKIPLSGSTNGAPVQITSTGGTGQTIHTATSTGGELDELFILACNNHTAVVVLTLQIGGTGASQIIKISLNSNEGLVITIPGLPLKGGIVVTAIADTASVVNIMGHVIRSA